MIDSSPSAMGNYELQGGEDIEQIRKEKLHEGCRVSIDIMGSRGVKDWIATCRDVHHCRNVKFHHRLIKRIPPGISQRRLFPVSAGGIRVQIKSHKTKVLNTSFELGNGVSGTHTRRLRQLTHPNEVARKNSADPVNQ